MDKAPSRPWREQTRPSKGGPAPETPEREAPERESPEQGISAASPSGAVARSEDLLEEKELVERMMAGDEAAFDRFADEYLPMLYRFATSRLKNVELSREIVQTTVCKAIAKLGTFRAEAPFSTWLCACCRNEIGMYLRKKERTEVQLDDDTPLTLDTWREGADLDGPEATLFAKEKAGLVHQTLDALPPRYASVLEWKYLEQISVVEIAERLKVTAKAAESMLSRARLTFKKSYELRVKSIAGE